MTDLSLPRRRGLALPWPLLALVLALLLALVILGGWRLGAALRPYTFHGLLLQSPDPAPNFVMTSHRGDPVALSDFRGKVVMLFFGYTNCPDVCPATLATLRQARLALGDQAADVQMLMVSVDPQRDTPDKMTSYLAHFDSSFIGLIGAPEQVSQLATSYGVFFAPRPVDSALGYVVDHTATVMVIDRQGYLRLVFPLGVPADDIAADVSYLLRR